MALTKVSRGLLSTSIVDNGNATAITIDSSEQVGIGSSDPSAVLEVRGVAPNYTLAATTFWGGTTNNDDHNGIMLSSYGNALGGSVGSNLTYTNSATPSQTNTSRSSGEIQFANTTTGSKTSDIKFGGYVKGSTTFSERLRIDASGNLLVGKTGSSFGTDGFQANADGQIWATNASASVTAFNRRTTDGAISVFYKDGVSVGSIRSISGDSIGIGNGDAGLRFISSTNRIQPVDMDNGLNSDALTSLGDTNKRFKDLYLSGNVIASGTPSSTVVGVRVNNSGNNFDLINTSCGSATTTKTHILFTNGNGNVGTIKTNGSATSYNSPSDYRLKENIIAMSGATERLKQLAPKRFNFIADADTTVDGFLAHEVQDIVPEAISGTKDAMIDEEYEVTPEVLDDEGNVITEAVMGTRSVPDYQGIDQSKLVPLLVAAIQELEARITQLEN